MLYPAVMILALADMKMACEQEKKSLEEELEKLRLSLQVEIPYSVSTHPPVPPPFTYNVSTHSVHIPTFPLYWLL